MLTLLRGTRVRPYIKVEVLFLAGVLDSELRFSYHRSFGIEYLFAVLVNHGSFSATYIVFKVKACASVAKFGLLELWILLFAIFYFCHKSLII